MTPKQFLDLVEIRVVIPSVAPLLVGLTYSQWQYSRINWLNALLLILATISIHLAVNTFNRYEDAKRQKQNEFLRDNARGERLSSKQVLIVAAVLALLAVLAGISVALRTGYVTWVIGIASFLIGYLYSAGPKPITNTPFGEIVSGITMGYFIFVAQVYVNTGMTISGHVLWQWFVVSFPLTIFIAEIMLANNIADYEEDESNKRYTLVHYLGITAAKKLYLFLAFIAVLEMMIVTLAGWLPATTYAVIMLVPLISMQAQRFVLRPIKKETFVLAIKNLVIVMFGMTVAITAGMML